MSLAVDRLSLSSEQYTRWCAETRSLPLYVQPWWLQAASGMGEMDVLTTTGSKEGAPTLMWPLFMPTRRYLIVPPCCQFAGPLSDRSGAVGEKPFDRNRYIAHLAAMQALGEALPSSLRYIEAHLPLEYWDWLPCETPAGAWRSSVAYTHLLDLTQSLPQELYNSLIRRKVRRATALGLRELWAEETNVSTCAQMLVDLCHKSLLRSGGDRLCASSLRRLVTAAVARRQGALLLLLSPQTDEPVAGAFVAHHAGTAYYIAGGQARTPEGEDAMALLLDRLITWSREAGCHTFDFEGSMQSGIAFFFRNFGAVPHPYLRLQAGRQTLAMRLQLRRYYLQHLY
ncbi:MAG: GNAT family N-acetyltransferase [Porphyromonas sp.]|uniref:GNAT family N-acetyltransferase n=1 Tax=Porphyromonas sp. TaxID=1924944 RepID=UPI002A7610CC|nr:GNAT family N-acetyltransferase [Porphyromonas sp.]MDY3111205.1 GNAT family N-acetyltransferase [Porphyromonas sp.]